MKTRLSPSEVHSLLLSKFESLLYDVEEAKGSVHDFTMCKMTLLQMVGLWIIMNRA
jgi:hypothetical protein